MSRKYLWLLVALAGCGDPKLEVAVYAGPHGATIARMAASGIRQSQAVKDRRFEARPIAQLAVVRDSLTPAMLRASLDSIAEDTLVVAVLMRLYMESATTATRELNRAGVPYISLHPTAPELTGGA